MFSEEETEENKKRIDNVANNVALGGTALSVGGAAGYYGVGRALAKGKIDSAVRNKVGQVSSDSAREVRGVRKKWYDLFGIGKNRRISKIAQRSSNKIANIEKAGEELKRRTNNKLLRGALTAASIGSLASSAGAIGVNKYRQHKNNQEEKQYSEKEELKKTHSVGKGLGRATSLGIGSNIGGHIGRKAGIIKANKSDKKGKSDLEIIDDASKTAGNVGTATGLVAGAAVGGAAGYAAKKGLEELSEQAKTAKLDAKALKIGGKGIKGVGKLISNLPIIGRRYLIHPEKGKFTTGKIIDGMANSVGKGVDKLSRVEDLAGKLQRGTKKAAVPVAVGLTALGAAHGAISGRSHAKSGAEKHTISRLNKRNKKEKE